MKKKNLVSVAEFSVLYGLTKQAITQRIRSKTLKANKVGSQWVIDMDDFKV